MALRMTDSAWKELIKVNPGMEYGACSVELEFLAEDLMIMYIHNKTNKKTAKLMVTGTIDSIGIESEDTRLASEAIIYSKRLSREQDQLNGIKEYEIDGEQELPEETSAD